MRVMYAGKDSRKHRKWLSEHKDVIVLLYNNWDDYGNKTTFPTDCRIAGDSVELGTVKILFEDRLTSYAYLDTLVAQGWDGLFPPPDGTAYISVPESLTFYEQIQGRLGQAAILDVAQILRDASYLTRLKDDPDALRLANTEPFRSSLQRERGAIRAYLDGWKLFGGREIAIGSQTFTFRGPVGETRSIDLRFESATPLPHDVNVLIGPNGVGKSQLLRQMVDHWLELAPNDDGVLGFAERPNLSQLVVVSYSPFELFPVDSTDGPKRLDADVYRYFGLRGRMKTLTQSKRGSDKVMLSREFPKTNAARSLLACLADDKKYGAIKDWSNKLATVERVLNLAFDFDRAAVVVDAEANVDEFFVTQTFLTQPHLEGDVQDEDGQATNQRYIPISADRVGDLNLAALNKHVQDRLGVVFLKDGAPVHLSSGQRLFSYIVINILGAIRRNSLVLVDEPELFLHPTLEIAFIRMLKEILSSYGSKALVATHSLVTVREIPRSCVHVLEQTEEGLAINTPPFETFGGDVQRISSYVFGDKSLSKPYEEWLGEQLIKMGSAQELIRVLGDDVNEEMIIQIHAMARGQW